MPNRFLAILRGVADIPNIRSHERGEAVFQRGNNAARVVNRQSCLRNIRQLLGIMNLQRCDVVNGLYEVDGAVDLANCPLNFSMACVPDQNDFPPLRSVTPAFGVHFGNQWTGSIDDGQLPLLCIPLDLLGHAEVEGTIGQIDGTVYLVQTVDDVAALKVHDAEKLAYITQTTLSVDDARGIIAALKSRFPSIMGPDVRDICYATQNRQEAVRHLAEQVDVILVVGSRNSSNSNRLREIGEDLGCRAYLIDDADHLDPSWFDGVERVGLTAGASAPEILVRGVLEGLKRFGSVEVETLAGTPEDVRFKLPVEVAGI